MSFNAKVAAGVLLTAILLAGGLLAYRLASPRREALPDGYAMLTPVPGSSGFEPTQRPEAPVLRNRAPGSLAIDFGYAVGGVPYAYTLSLSFPAGAAAGRALLSVHRGGSSASTDSQAFRRWDEPRAAYAVALSDKFMTVPPMPGLCLKAVLGPALTRYDLADGTLCVAQRDGGGACHPETLACGLLRP